MNHLPVSRKYMGCAFTQKVHKMCGMLLSLGHEVFLYGAEGSDAPCTEFIQTHTLQEIRNEWGDAGNDDDIGYPWMEQDFRHDISGEPGRLTAQVRSRMALAINNRKRSDDFLLITQGYYQKPVADAVDLFLTVEPGIGYRGSWARFRAFESTYIQNFTYGSSNPFGSSDGFWYDRVIPNYFDQNDFPLAKEKGDYLLYVGRMIRRKGIQAAVLTAKATGMRLILAGQGTYPVDYDRAEFVGYVGPKERAKLMGGAVATLAPTYYLEPFGGTAVESMMCGTPAITTDWGAYTDTVINGVTGFRCHTLRDFVRAVELAPELEPATIQAIARARYSMENVKHQFQKWFDDLYQLYLSAENSEVLGWNHLP